MNRKIWIKNVAIAAAGFALLPSCTFLNDDKPLQLKNISVDGKLQNLLGDIVGCIIPATDTLGAKDLNLDLFVLKMIDECYEKNEQDKFVSGINKFQLFCKQHTGSSFAALDENAQNTLLKNISSPKFNEKDIQFFLLTARHLTVLSYKQSKYVMTELIPYNIAPGYFHGCEEAFKVLN